MEFEDHEKLNTYGINLDYLDYLRQLPLQRKTLSMFIIYVFTNAPSGVGERPGRKVFKNEGQKEQY